MKNLATSSGEFADCKQQNTPRLSFLCSGRSKGGSLPSGTHICGYYIPFHCTFKGAVPLKNKEIQSSSPPPDDINSGSQ